MHTLSFKEKERECDEHNANEALKLLGSVRTKKSKERILRYMNKLQKEYKCQLMLYYQPPHPIAG